MKNNPKFQINIPYEMCVIGVGVTAIALGALTCNETISRIALSREDAISTTQQASKFETDAYLEKSKLEAENDEAQSAIDNYTPKFNSVTVTGYVCSSEPPHGVDWQTFEGLDKIVYIADENLRIVGYLNPSNEGGGFVFTPENCNL